MMDGLVGKKLSAINSHAASAGWCYVGQDFLSQFVYVTLAATFTS